MDFVVYNQSIINNNSLLEFIFKTLKENLSYIYGEDMLSSENRKAWVDNNLLNDKTYWRIVVAYDNCKPCGFLIYTIKDNVFIVNDVELNMNYRFKPKILYGLFANAFLLEKGKWNILSGYINHKNLQSKKNFLKLSTEILEKRNGITIIVTKEEIKKRFLIKKEII